MEKVKSYIIFGLITALVIILSVHRCSKQEAELSGITGQLESKINAKEKELVSLRNDGEEKRIQWHKDSLEIIARSERFKQVATKATKERDIARAKIQEIVNTVPAVKEFVEKDSLSDQINIDRIRELGIENVSIQTSYESRLSKKDEQLKVMQGIIHDLEETNAILSKQVRKERNKKTFYKIVSGIAIGGLIFASFNN